MSKPHDACSDTIYLQNQITRVTYPLAHTNFYYFTVVHNIHTCTRRLRSTITSKNHCLLIQATFITSLLLFLRSHVFNLFQIQSSTCSLTYQHIYILVFIYTCFITSCSKLLRKKLVNLTFQRQR